MPVVIALLDGLLNKRFVVASDKLADSLHTGCGIGIEEDVKGIKAGFF